MDALKEFGYAEWVAARLQGKFDLTVSQTGDNDWRGVWRYRVEAMRGRKYHRIVFQHSLSANPDWDREQRMSHCFVDNDGNVYMSAGWTGPAKGVRYNISTAEGAQQFIDNADAYGSYLYANHKKVDA